VKSQAKAEYDRYRGCDRKVRYETIKEANTAKSDIPLRVYFCRYCEGYHRTHNMRGVNLHG